MTEDTISDNNAIENEEELDPIKESVSKLDPIIEFLSRVEFKDVLIQQLIESGQNSELYSKFFKFPDILVYWDAYIVLGYDNPDSDSKDNQAFQTLIHWMMIKMATHPYWFQRIGWFNRFVAAHNNPSSYYPLKYSPFFLPANWKGMDGDWNAKQVNEEAKPGFEDIYAWNSNDKKFEDLERVVGLEWLANKVQERMGRPTTPVEEPAVPVEDTIIEQSPVQG